MNLLQTLLAKGSPLSRPICLSIAGSDPSGGAGIQADLKTFSALGVYGAAALAGLTAQNTQGVRDARALDPEFVAAQVAAVIDDLPVAATKIGMLTDAPTARGVAELIEAPGRLRRRRARPGDGGHLGRPPAERGRRGRRP